MRVRVGPADIYLERGDITEYEVDAIVNAANGDLSMSTGVPSTIKRKGGTIVEEEAARYGHELAEVLTVKPGMTGLWQVSGRSRLTYQERVGLDVWYVRRGRRLRRDLTICVRTIGLLTGRGGA